MNRSALAAKLQRKHAFLSRSRPPQSVHARVKAIQQLHPPSVPAGILHGLEQRDQLKAAIRAKVSWRQGLPNGTISYTEMLQHALQMPHPEINGAQRLLVVLRRMLEVHLRRGKPVRVDQGLMDECAHSALSFLLKEAKKEDYHSKLARCLAEISWWQRRNTDTRSAVWLLLEMVAYQDTQASKDALSRYRRALSILRISQAEVPLLCQVLESKNLACGLINDLFEYAISNNLIDCSVAAAFYTSSLNCFDQIPDVILQALVAHSECALKTKDSKAIVALAHLYAAQGSKEQAWRYLACFDQLTEQTSWPLGAVAKAIQVNSEAGRDICDYVPLLAAVATRDRALFMQYAAKPYVFNTAETREALLDNELCIRLSWIGSTDTQPAVYPASDSFLALITGHVHPAFILQRLKAYYGAVEPMLLQSGSKAHQLCKDLAIEAGELAFILRSETPLLLLLQSLEKSSLHSANTTAVAATEAAELLDTLTCCFSKLASVKATGKARCWRSESYKALLIAYLKQGIEPSTDALAAFHNIISHSGDSSTNTSKALQLSAALLPLALPSKITSSPDVKLFYEHLLRLLARKSPRKQLFVLKYLLFQPNIRSPKVLEDFIELAAAEYLRCGNFMNHGFFRLERIIVRGVYSRKLSEAYRNSLWPRLWALHMFLRH
ncbi:hypothetical protein GGI07_004176 [Coemansia sp. Benny D115]|nr:hypothetical protein GGI07_004176 [Coemansia sp. Benny D115]